MLGEKPSARTKMPLLKVCGGHEMEFVCVAREALGVHIHWLATRTFMCPGVDCAACFATIGTRWVGFLPVRWKAAHEKSLHTSVLELACGTHDRLEGLQRMLGLESLLGVRCCASRTRDRASLRVEPITENAADVVRVKEFPEWLLMDAMATLYNLPSCQEGFTRAKWEELAVPRAAQMIRTALPRVLAGHA